VSRTRKREVQEWRVVREPRSEFVTMYPEEAEFYREVTEAVREYALARAVHEGFLLATPQRQMSSCMYAAATSWGSRTGWDDMLLYEDQGYEGDEDEVGSLVQYIAARVLPHVDVTKLYRQDSKYERLREVLVEFLRERPDEKVMLFSYFRGTLTYLERRLKSDGIRARVLLGGFGGDRQALIEAFRDSDEERVLLSSEVASEGVDLQFAWVLVNYDLPWNPMKVEQRIGRVDRLGQESPVVRIWNMGYQDTIDQRIHDRLHLRLGIFTGALGGLEEILGAEIRRLTADLLTRKLTKEQEEARILQTETAIANIRRETEQLEQQASSLVAHGGYILARWLHPRTSSRSAGLRTADHRSRSRRLRP